jgi:hypothetical protein
MTKGLQRAGGAAALTAALAFVFVFALCLTIVAIALHERLKQGSPSISAIAAALGLMYSAFVLLRGRAMGSDPQVRQRPGSP